LNATAFGIRPSSFTLGSAQTEKGDLVISFDRTRDSC